MRKKFQFQHLLLALLVVETAILVYISGGKVLFSRSVITAEPGKKYSFLIDDERFPLEAEPGQNIEIKVIDRREAGQPLPSGRTVVHFLPKEHAMARVTDPRFKFYFDTPQTLAPLYEKEKLATLRKQGDWATARAVMGWARRQFPMGTPREYPTQNAVELLPLLRSGAEEGFCAQYCYVFVQAMQAMGYAARYVTILGHEVAEVWLPENSKWVCFDPTNEAFFENSKGVPLSAVEISRGGKSVVVQSPRFTGDKTDLIGRFRVVYFWLRNDLVSHPINIYDLGRYRVRAVFTRNDLGEVAPGDLFTVYPDEMYFPPT